MSGSSLPSPSPTAPRSLLRSPLLRFALAGLVLFGLVRLLGGSAPGDDGTGTGTTIAVERAALLDFVQLRSGEADASALAARWDRLAPATRGVWIDRFVREEALVREARRLGLGRDDDLIRRRLVQKLEFLMEARIDDVIDDATFSRVYAERSEQHRVPAIVTFSHVFVEDAEALSLDASGRAYGRAADLRDAMNGEGVVLEEAGERGDRFLYNRVYVDRTIDEVRSHFGAELAEALQALEPHPTRWQGPLASQHGWHVVLLTRGEPSRVPPLDEIRRVLKEEILRERRDASRERGISGIVEGYTPRIAADVHPPRSAVDPAMP